jgi:16S rRNA (cytosine967-C5)-methyltransferase
MTVDSPMSPQTPGLSARCAAADLLEGVLHRKRPLDEQLGGIYAHDGRCGLSERDRALARRIAATVLRRLGTLRYIIGELLDRG